MGRTVVDAWLGLLRRQRRDAGGGNGLDAAASTSAAPPSTVDVLALEVAALVSRVAHLWHSLADDQVARLRDDVLRLDGVRKLVSDDRGFLLSLALSEMLDALCGAARSAALLARRCSVPALRRLEHVLPEIVSAAVPGGEGLASEYALAGLHGWAFSERKMERKVRKMERMAAATVHLYQEMEVLAEMEQSLRRAQGNASSSLSGFFQGFSLVDLRQRVSWQRQEVKALRDQSLWRRSFDYVVRLLARSLFTILLRINLVFGFHRTPPNAAVGQGDGDPRASSLVPRSRSVAGRAAHASFRQAHDDDDACTAADVRFCSGPLERSRTKSASMAAGARSGPIATAKGINAAGGPRPAPNGQLPPLPAAAGGGKHPWTKTRWSVSGGPFRGCMMVAGSDSPVLQQDNGGFRRSRIARSQDPNSGAVPRRTQFRGGTLGADVSPSLFYPKRNKLLCAPPSTLGASALALHYANIIIVIEKLVASPHLIGPEARDDLYRMLPTSIRVALRTRLKPYAKNLASCACDPVLAAEWSDAVTRILEWLAPLAHNMIRWQSERNYEQQHWVSRSNVLLLQTLYFANQAKTEAAIVELLVGLNYLWRFARETNGQAILECVGNRDFADCQDTKSTSTLVSFGLKNMHKPLLASVM